MGPVTTARRQGAALRIGGSVEAVQNGWNLSKGGSNGVGQSQGSAAGHCFSGWVAADGPERSVGKGGGQRRPAQVSLVVAHRRRAVPVAEAAGDGVQVDAGGEQLGGGVVPQGVEVGVDAELVGEALVAPGDRTRVPGLPKIRRG